MLENENGFQSIEEIISNHEGFKKIRTFITINDIKEIFFENFPALKQVITKVELKNNVLRLKVEDSNWRSELKFNQQTILEKINSVIPDLEIESIKFIS